MTPKVDPNINVVISINPHSNTTVRDPDLANQPNKYAPKSSLSTSGEVVHFEGYQTFDLDTQSFELAPKTESLAIKKNLLARYLTPQVLTGRTVLDLGGNNGFYALSCLAGGAIESTVVDLDPAPIANLRQLNQLHPKIPIKGLNANVTSWQTPKDIVIAFALIHWIYNLTTGLGSLEKAITFLSDLTEDLLFVEWVDPADPVIVEFNHTGLKGEAGASDYSQVNFEKILLDKFTYVANLGAVSSTRHLYVASRKKIFEIDYSWQEPFLPLADTKLLHSRQLTPGCWSRVYEQKDQIIKQVSLSQGLAEFEILSRIDHPAIPKVRLLDQNQNSVTFELEKKSGKTLKEICAQHPKSTQDVIQIMRQIGMAIEHLRGLGIAHNDLHPENILWDPESRRATLIDFGWSRISLQSAALQPALPMQLGEMTYFWGKPPQDIPADQYAYGALLLWLNQDRSLALKLLGHGCLLAMQSVADVVEKLEPAEDHLEAALRRDLKFMRRIQEDAYQVQEQVQSTLLARGLRPFWNPAIDIKRLGELAHQSAARIGVLESSHHEKDRLMSEKDRLLSEKDRLMSEKDRLMSEKDRLMSEKDHALEQAQRQIQTLTAEVNRPFKEIFKSRLKRKLRRMLGDPS